MSSNRSYVEDYERSETLKYWVGREEPPDKQNAGGLFAGITESQGYRLEISEQAKQLLGQYKAEEVLELDEGDLASSKEEIKIQMIEKFIEVLSGKKIKLHVPEKIKTNKKECEDVKTQDSSKAEQDGKVGWDLDTIFTRVYYEKETTTFSAEGIIKTSDGKKIKIDIDLSMSREFMSSQDII
jgi:hypothetical protein